MRLILGNYQSMSMPLSDAVRLNAYASSMYSDDTRAAASHLMQVFRLSPLYMPRQAVLILYTRDMREDEEVTRHDEYVELDRQEVIRQDDRKHAMDILDVLSSNVPDEATYATVLHWEDAILTTLNFMVER